MSDTSLDREFATWRGSPPHYVSPRMAETWDVPERPVTFETLSPGQARQVMQNYSSDLARDRLAAVPANELFAKRAQRSTYESWDQPSPDRLSPFEQGFRVDPAADETRKKKRGFFARLFGLGRD